MKARTAARGRFVSTVAAALWTCSVPTVAAQFEFRCATTLPVDHPLSVRGRQMWEAIERESGGRIRASYFPNDQLGSEPAMLAQLRIGAIHFLVIAPGTLQQVAPAVAIGDLYYAFKDEDEACRVMDGPLGEYLRGEVGAKGFYVLHRIWDNGMRDITSSSRPIRSSADLTEFKIRVNESRITLDFYRTLGASPTPVAFNELYTALQTKLVDGCDLPLSTVESLHVYEVQRYLALTNHNWSGLWEVANGEVWKSLPGDLQDLIERNNTKYVRLERRDTQLINASVAEKLGRQGLAINKVDPATFRSRLGAFYGRWSSAFGSTAWGLLQSSVRTKLG